MIDVFDADFFIGCLGGVEEGLELTLLGYSAEKISLATCYKKSPHSFRCF